MKFAVSGKGGVGKTSVSIGLCRHYAEKGFSVLAVDADPSLNLSTMFGVKKPRPLSEMKELADDRARVQGGLVRMNPEVSDLVDEYSTEVSENLKLLVMGTVSGAGAGCLCPENAILRSLLSNLVLGRDEVVVIDLVAGLEPMSRGTVRAIDALLIVCEPSANSAHVTERLVRLSGELGVKNCFVVANKVRDGGDEEYLKGRFAVYHSIPYDEEYSKESREGAYPKKSRFNDSVRGLAEKLGGVS